MGEGCQKKSLITPHFPVILPYNKQVPRVPNQQIVLDVTKLKTGSQSVN